jgi:hypothetical protein
MTLPWQPYREPVRATLLRTVGLALVLGAVLARSSGGPARFLLWTSIMLWPLLGGHFVELWFLNWLRPRLPGPRVAQATARVIVWFVSGAGLALCMYLTALAFAGHRTARWPAWWVGGLAFVGVELAVHLILQLRGRPNFYSGRG